MARIANVDGATAKLTSRGRVTIPAVIREEFGMRPGCRVYFVEDNEKPPVLLDGDVVIRYSAAQ